MVRCVVLNNTLNNSNYNDDGTNIYSMCCEKLIKQ